MFVCVCMWYILFGHFFYHLLCCYSFHTGFQEMKSNLSSIAFIDNNLSCHRNDWNDNLKRSKSSHRMQSILDLLLTHFRWRVLMMMPLPICDSTHEWVYVYMAIYILRNVDRNKFDMLNNNLWVYHYKYHNK